MLRLTFIFATLLVVNGILGYLLGTPDADGKVSPTALIPAFFGAALLLLGIGSLVDKLRMALMHVAMVLALVGIIGAGSRLPAAISELNEVDGTSPVKMISILVMMLLMIGYLGLGVRSFIEARKVKKAMQNAEV